jgi:hypothetical protein
VAAVGAVWWVAGIVGRVPQNERRSSAVAWACFVAGALPFLIYDAWAVLSHPALAEWNRQNLTPSPGVLETALAYLPLLILAAVGVADRERRQLAAVRFLTVWAVVGLLLMYAPYGLQRRLALGLYVPLAALGAYGVARLSPRLRWAPAALLLMTLPSTLMVIAAGVSGAARGDPSLVLTRDELAAYAWIDANAPPDGLLLAGPRAGNRLPAYSNVRVIYGHPFETPRAEAERAWVESLYAWDGPAEGAIADLRDRQVDYVYVGPEEAGLGGLEWTGALVREFATGAVSVYRVPPP